MPCTRTSTKIRQPSIFSDKLLSRVIFCPVYKNSPVEMSSKCSRGSIENPDTGRCRACTGFSVAELQRITRSVGGLTMYNSKDRLCRQLLRALGGRSTSPASPAPRRRRKSVSRSRSRSTRRTYRVPTHYTSRRSRSRTPSQRRAPRRSVSYTRRGTRLVRTPRSYPRSGQGSLQARHSKSTRKGPPMPASAHCNERARGNDGNYWESRPFGSGNSCRWFRL